MFGEQETIGALAVDMVKAWKICTRG